MSRTPARDLKQFFRPPASASVSAAGIRRLGPFNDTEAIRFDQAQAYLLADQIRAFFSAKIPDIDFANVGEFRGL